MTNKILVTGGYNFESSKCPHCEAPTLEKTNTQEDCENCGYWFVYATGEGDKGSRQK